MSACAQKEVDTFSRRMWYQSLRHLAARNRPVEVTPLVREGESTDSGEAAGGREPLVAAGPSCQTRVLEVHADDSLTLELPSRPAEAWPLRRAAAADVLLVNEGQRWVGRCPLRREVQHPLGDRQRVLAVRLGVATEVRSGQRRNFFRAALTGVEPVVVRLSPVERGGVGSRTVLETRLLNLSGTGLGLCLDRPRADEPAIVPGRVYQCEFALPGDAVPLRLRAQLIHARPTCEEGIYLGMAFEFASRREQHRVQEQIVRFTTQLERQQLQRRRA